MVSVSTNVDGFDKLQKHLDLVYKIVKIGKDNTKFIKFIMQKAYDTLYETMDERLKGGTTNDADITLYRNSNKFEMIENGFILYNDASIDANEYNRIPFDTSGYPNGRFSIALAFEFGTGMVGTLTNVEFFKAWTYNDLKHSKSESHQRFKTNWYLPKDAQTNHTTAQGGYTGFEVYRYTADKCNKRVVNWINEFLEKEV